jgi:hypothetical protein
LLNRMIRITLKEYEVNDADKGNYYYLRGEVADEGFTGWSDFVVAEYYLRSFTEELRDFAKEFKGTPELRAGWGDEVYFRLRLEKWKATGVLWIDGEVASPARSRTDSNPPCSHRFIFGFPTDPAQFDTFLASLLSLINGVGEVVILHGKDE